MEVDNFFDEMISSQNPDGDADHKTEDKSQNQNDVAVDGDDSLFETDPLLLPMDTQQAIQKLLKAGKIEMERHPNYYQALLRDAVSVRTFLQNLAITLHIDVSEGMAFTGQFENEEGESLGSLIHVQTIKLHETWVMLILREYYQEREAAGERVISIDIEDIESRLLPYMPISKSESADRGRLTGFLNRLVTKYRILSMDKSGQERYQISSVIRHVVSAEELKVLLEDYRRMAEEAVDGGLVDKADLSDEPYTDTDEGDHQDAEPHKLQYKQGEL